MKYRILKQHVEVDKYISEVIAFADANKKALGFLPHSAYEEQALQGKLWVAVDSDTQRCAGYLMFGTNFPKMRVVQVYVQPIDRRNDLASLLINELVKYGEEKSFLTIVSKVAVDLPANKFWESAGFKMIKQVFGGVSTGRLINIRARELNTPSLFSLMTKENESQSVCLHYESTPWARNQLYLIDINILLDIVRDRGASLEASSVIRAGLNNIIRVGITEEFINELEKNRILQDDPLIRLARSAFPTVRLLDKRESVKLLGELQHIVFPGRILGSKRSKNDRSDLIHLATCISTKSRGFITREKAILKAKDALFDRYKIEVLSPADLSEPIEGKAISDKEVRLENRKVKIRQVFDDAIIPNEVVQFLSNLSLTNNEMSDVWAVGTTGSTRKRHLVYIDDILVAVSSWEVPQKINLEIVSYLLVNEDDEQAVNVIDHLLETMSRSCMAGQTIKITLKISNVQTLTRATAIERGFVSTFIGGLGSIDLVKVSHFGLLTDKNWSVFRRDFLKLTGLNVNEYIPVFDSVEEKKMVLENPNNSQKYLLSIYDFESLISPALIIGKNRKGVLLPIQANYANELGISLPRQLTLLPYKEALLHVEKAYFRDISRSKSYEKGMIIIFYLSGCSCDSQLIAGCGRITHSAVHHLNDIKARFFRQGVLTEDELQSIAKERNKIHVMTFGSYLDVTKTVDYNYLKRKSHISKANLVTGEIKEFYQIYDILSNAFSGEAK